MILPIFVKYTHNFNGEPKIVLEKDGRRKKQLSTCHIFNIGMHRRFQMEEDIVAAVFCSKLGYEQS